MRFLPYFVALSALVAAVPACRRETERDRRAAAEATAAAEQRAQEATLTGAAVELAREGRDADQAGHAGAGAEAEVAKAESATAFQLEQSDFRERLRGALDGLDAAADKVRASGARRADGRLGDLRTRRSLLKGDLELLERSTEQDWATTRTKLARDLDTPTGAQLAPDARGAP